MVNDELHFLLLKAFNVSSRSIQAQTGELGLTPGQPKVLEYLLEHDGSQARDICRGFAIDKSTMASLLPRMEKAGLVRRETSEKDRRASLVWLTDKGREQALIAKQIILAVDAELTVGVSADDLAACERVLSAIASHADVK
jgi:MarR family transcriptional regulator, organic hydroperoxide resistance regulator